MPYRLTVFTSSMGTILNVVAVAARAGNAQLLPIASLIPCTAFFAISEDILSIKRAHIYFWKNIFFNDFTQKIFKVYLYPQIGL